MGAVGGHKRGSLVVPINTDTGLTIAHHQRVLDVTAGVGGDVTITIPAAGNLPDGFECVIRRNPASANDVILATGVSRTLTEDAEGVILVADSGGWIYYPTIGPTGAAGPSNITASTETDLTGTLRGDGANVSATKDNLTATSAPTAGDDSGDGYAVGSRWIDVSADKEYVCLDASVGAAVWTETTGGGGFGVGFMATANSNQTVSTSTFTKVNMTTEEWDSNGWYDAANAKYTPLVAGRYLVIVSVLVDQMADGKQIIPYAYKNGAAAKRGQTIPGGGAQGHQLASLSLVDMNGSTDYLEAYIYHNHGADRTLLGGAAYNYFQAVRVG